MTPEPLELNSDALPRVCEILLHYTEGDRYAVDTPFDALVVGTFRRSTLSMQAIVGLVGNGLPVQAAMLSRALFEDLVVGHWLVLNADDNDWLVKRFFRHRDAIALHQIKLQREHGWALGVPIVPDTPELRAKQNALVKEFGQGARRNWWDPGRDGRGSGSDIGLTGVAAILEDAARDRKMFHPRFAGGDEPLLRRWDAVVQKWLSQFIHHTAIGLPYGIAETDLTAPEEFPDPSGFVLFAAYWMYAQQIYLLHDLYLRPTDDFDDVFRRCWAMLNVPLPDG